ncbi:glycosyl transferase family protein [Acetobacter aceti NRIC 0242]|uniref:Glycosyl transferase family 25 domain-containing protein n=1 Tax=Acetobacter aceti NBRC 14818 TaxID=887700 RepID=A0AB33I7I2_ACEAC|nr:glycosyltransferase family 25 protein [Acetobacter aceti]TCS34939.1 glycosyl transferase family 25 [Acetobacter aceti NBRC 14818]BCK74481.1 hypothetical protein EMQ_0087 [Acetobacter aceti NBRC 14818]GAN55990.1 glycosyl transferase [Acetobacter aceti NBRC 14818]GBO80170.1 glycosyl transferase family protein [Acetobacter aceti NRIC 0242]
MKYIYINRDKDADRRSTFLENNSHISDLRRFCAIEGTSLDIDELRAAGMIEGNPEYNMASYGNALSHMLLWSAVQEHGEATCIFEDDAITCKNFVEMSEKTIASLPENWDIILWGNNHDTTLVIDMLSGVTPCIISYYEFFTQKNTDKFREMNVECLSFRLMQTFGICGYSVSPKGASALLQACNPIKECEYFHMGINRNVPNGGIDHIMSYNYKNMNSYASFPPLCLTKNDKEISTITNRA